MIKRIILQVTLKLLHVKLHKKILFYCGEFICFQLYFLNISFKKIYNANPQESLIGLSVHAICFDHKCSLFSLYKEFDAHLLFIIFGYNEYAKKKHTILIQSR